MVEAAPEPDVEQWHSRRRLHNEDISESQVGSTDFSVDEDIRKRLAKRETKAVHWLRVTVLLILLSAAASSAALVYTYIRNSQESEFYETFNDFAQQIISATERTALNKMEAIVALASLIQAHAIDTNQSWPLVTVSFFETHVLATRSLTEAYGVTLFPIVESSEREEWERYSIEHRGWINESYAAQRENFGHDNLGLNETEEDVDWFDFLWSSEYRDPLNPDFSSGIANKIFRTRHENDDDHKPKIDTSPGPYYPQWQAAPMSAYYQSSVNLNYGCYDDFLQQTEIIRNTSNSAFGIAWTDQSTDGYVSTLLYPLFSQFYGANKEVVAFLGLDLLWNSFLKSILHQGNKGVHVVVENTCNQTFSFLLEKDGSTFLGDGDAHDTNYDSMERSTLFGHKLMEPVSEETYIGAPLFADFCATTFRIYPTKTMEEYYVNNLPVVATVVVLGVFLFTSLVFVLYDWIVERRQKLVMTTATRADRLVSSLFPKEVKQQLYEKNASEELFPENEVTEFMGAENPNKRSSYMSVNPIANLYEETTIMFADLVGFTQWSSGRVPADVFLLLETIYGDFDKIARRRRVFKVETIGDCYVAVTGIPKPQKDHALIMTKFAQDCMLKMKQTLVELQVQLGGTTQDLAMRVGLHSGSVTAGVLRGDKSRFQLFGDTMNTASRMESNGQPHRIHVSEATAKLLEQAGKTHWIAEREDRIIAKGKGEMRTFWVDSMRSDCDKSHRSSDDCTSSCVVTNSGSSEDGANEITDLRDFDKILYD